MARQSGNITITGTIDNLCFYRMDGKFYVRRKSSLSGKRVKKDPAFRATMQYAGLFGRAAKLASQLYRSLPEAAKTKGLYRQLTGKAMLMLKDGYTPEDVAVLLQEGLLPKPIVKKKPISVEPACERYIYADAVIAGIAGDDHTSDNAVLLPRISHSPP